VPTSRRDQILTSAAELFARRGFHGVSITELGAACGVSGPALYKHFVSKEAILSEMLVGISERLLSEGRARAGAAEDPLAALIGWHVEFALEHPALIVVQDRDFSALPTEARETVRRLQLEYVDLWADVLRASRRDLRVVDARARAHAVFGLINSTPHSARLPAQQMRDLLASMAHAAALAP